jgi:hypothetical protein
MGYYKNLEVELQGEFMPHPAPKPAADHVALQVPVVRRRDLRVKPQPSFAWVGWLLTLVALITATIILVVSL